MGIDVKAEFEKLTEAELQDVAKPAPSVVGALDVDKPKALAVLAKLREVEKNNGHVGIATSEGIPVNWVKEIDAIRKTVITEKAVAQVEAMEK